MNLESLKYRLGITKDLIKKGDFLKLGNFLLANLNMFVKPSYVFSQPYILVIDPGNVCNLRCALCAVNSSQIKRPRVLLSLENFKKIIDELGKYLIYIDLYNWGEPFLNPDIFKMISYASGKKIQTNISSNLNHFNELMAEEVIRSGLTNLIVSLDGASQETVEKYQRGSNFDRVMENIKFIIQKKKELKEKNPFIIWRFIVFHHNEHELGKAHKMAKDLGVDKIEFLPPKIDLGGGPEKIKEKIKANKNLLPQNEKYNLYDLKTFELKNKNRVCHWPWELVSINPDGSVAPCCVFYDLNTCFDNFFQSPFSKIWNGKKYRLSRKIIKERIKNNKEVICGPCSDYNFPYL